MALNFWRITMNAKEYIKKYELDTQTEFNREEFKDDLSVDFARILSKSRNSDESITREQFNRGVGIIRHLWEDIRKKCKKELGEGTWKYLYAVVIIPMKKELFENNKQK